MVNVFQRRKINGIKKNLGELAKVLGNPDLLKEISEYARAISSFASAEGMIDYIEREFDLELFLKANHSKGNQWRGLVFIANQSEEELPNIYRRIYDYLSCGFESISAVPSDFSEAREVMPFDIRKPKFYDLKNVQLWIYTLQHGAENPWPEEWRYD